MKENKGQALVEFIIIIPVFLMMLFCIIDLGNIVYKKYRLENDLDYIVDLYRQNKIDEISIYANKKSFVTSIDNDNEMVTITIKQNINVNTPGMNLIIGNPYQISVDRVIYNEE